MEAEQAQIQHTPGFSKLSSPAQVCLGLLLAKSCLQRAGMRRR